MPDAAVHNAPSIPLPPTCEPPSIVEKWSQAATVISGLTVMSAVFYNWAYFRTAAPQVGQLLTISDQVASALQWLPVSVFGYSAGVVFNIAFIGRPLQGFGVRPIVHVMTIIALFLNYLISNPLDWVPVIAIANLWLLYVLSVARMPAWMDQVRPVLLLSLAVVMISLGKGNENALSDLSAHIPNAEIETKGHASISGVLLREIDKGVLLRTLEDNKIVLIPWDDVDQIKIVPANVMHYARLCTKLGLLCSVHVYN